ncbi:dihydropteroate synthetase, putative [Plasmodium knowlesi strain H]|uniref:2-amino-4-hydroxy-6-hydroxymethyldihydropteridine diphosphokinase n=3 Tax=Plasmodium knowlesi TaxID=5850 RepID=A0A5K1VQZ4_PLAKH|nr:hydroxymethyldihydropterin pyrophosphokinase-dihydropteroate synthase, putative [Plasmodium knowlesi strain H]OTN64306.1 putative Dihydropteroate synthase [Plasmodium knowlesi]CAA9990896.1 hydroxymethyldihydropterin pyrophosphokinase-dihydropteroate synthase, putative [Plasmodium knowlesi strain H]SBO20880.1 dihydropteroate synthetase, putative [Plasmodium knowlesi strain H]SBO21328.1 dihydropteroate synthetase, putative [Plasmodium knowlesi strain H]VVS80370.1 hydroxymethyldihydropterin py|eukprot:XP_002262182.1 dihydropteroate synthase, putative [Plasmodium knowlesi strain H]
MEDSNRWNSTPRNIAVLNFGTNDKQNCVTILETALYLTEKYLGKIINSSYIYETVPEYIVLDEAKKIGKVREEQAPNKISWIKDLIENVEKSRYEESEDLIYECKELEMFLKNEKINESIIKEVNVKDYENETRKIIKQNDEIMKTNLEKCKDKYYTSYFFNLAVVIRTFVEDPLTMLVILKYIEQIMKRRESKKCQGEIFENRIIDIDILFFNNYTIFEKSIELKKNDIHNIIKKYIHIDHTSDQNRLEIIQNLSDKIEFLCIPHVYTKYRYSILLCLNDIIPEYKHNTFDETIRSTYKNYINKFEYKYQINIRENNRKLYVLKDKVSYLKEKTHIVGILNVNYDSFSDGGLFVDPVKAVDRIFEMTNDGATVIDIGGESSAPYVVPNPNVTERDLVIPVLKLFKEKWHAFEHEVVNNAEGCAIMDDNKKNAQRDTEGATILQKVRDAKPTISIDTVNYDLFKECVEDDLVDILNDISACTHNPDIIKLLKRKNKFYTVVLMHKRGNPHTMDKLTNYDNLINDIKKYLEDRLNFLVLNGIPRYRILFDVGLGFAKKHDQSIKLLQNIHVYDEYPLFLGYSRKRFIVHCMGKNSASNGGLELTKGKSDVPNGKSELANGKSELANGKSELANGKSELANGKSELANGKSELANGKSELANGKSELANGKSELANGKFELANGHSKLANGNASQLWNFKMNHMRQDKDQLLYQKNICGGLAIASYSYYKKVDLIRVHDVLETKAVLDVLASIHES